MISRKIVKEKLSWIGSTKKMLFKFPKIHRKTPALESIFNKVAGLQSSNFLKEKLYLRYFPGQLVYKHPRKDASGNAKY